MSTLYHLFDFDRALKVRWLANELAIPLTVKKLDAHAGEHLKSDFKNLNPYGLIPTLVKDSGETLFEAAAICVDLCQQEKSSLIDLQDSQFLQWLFYLSSSLDQLSGTLIGLRVFGESSAIREKVEGKLPHKLAAMEKHLADHDYWYKNKFSLLDIFAWQNLAYLYCDNQLALYPNLSRYVVNLSERPTLKVFSPEKLLYPNKV